MAKLEPPRFENRQAMVIAGLRGHITFANWAGIPEQWERFVRSGPVPGKVGAPHYGLCFNMADGFDYLCGVEVSGAEGLDGEFTSVNVRAQRYAVFAHCGHVSKIRDTCDAIWRQWFPQSGQEFAPAAGGEPDFFERYGEGFHPQTGLGDIEVWIPIKS